MHLIAESDHSDGIRATLPDLATHAKAEKRAIAEPVRRNAEAVSLPRATLERAFMFEEMRLEDPVAGREDLRRMFDGEHVVVCMRPGDFYVAEGTLFPFSRFLAPRESAETPKPRRSRRVSGLPANRQSRASALVLQPALRGARCSLEHDPRDGPHIPPGRASPSATRW